MLNQSNEVGYNVPDKAHTIQTGELVLNPALEIQKASGDFVNNKYLVENICDIVGSLRAHQAKKLTKDQFLGLTIQFSDHYYKIDMSKDTGVFVERFNIITEAVQT